MGIVQIDVTQGKNLDKKLSGIKNGVPKVLSRALNKTATTARKKVVQLVFDATGIKKKGIRRGVKLTRATFKRLQSEVNAVDDERIPLIFFSAREFRSKKSHGGVTYKIAGEKRKIPYHKTRSAIFKTKLKSGHIGIFKREKDIGPRSKRPKIVERFGPSIPQMLSKPNTIQAVIEGTTAANLRKNVDVQTEVLIKQELAKGKK